MNQFFAPRAFNILPPVIKNLLIINGLFFLFTIPNWSISAWMYEHLALYSIESPLFTPHQLVTHQFMHGSFMHVFFNMFGLWMFGAVIENLIGSKRFLSFYLLSGIGAALFQLGISYWQYTTIKESVSPELLSNIKNQGAIALLEGKNFIDPLWAKINGIINTPMVGASGAVYGVLSAYAYFFPNQIIYFNLFIPIKAKYFVILMMAISFISQFSDAGGNIAHFAHLGGGVIGFLLIYFGEKRRRNNKFKNIWRN